MHNPPLEFALICSATCLVLRGITMFLTSLKDSARIIDNREIWIAADGARFEDNEMLPGKHKVIQFTIEDEDDGVLADLHHAA